MVARYPDRLAVKAKSRALTYVQLDAGANRIAHAVLERGGSVPAPIALLLDHGVSFIAALLGVLKAGKFYVPIDSALPHARAADLLSDLETRLILTNDANLSAARALVGDGVEVINIDALGERLPTEKPRVSVSPEDVAYIIYTSGSTGQPKGVVIDHRTVLHNTMNYTNGVHYRATDRISWLNALSTNAAATDIYPALLNGAALFPFSVKEEGVDNLTAWLSEEAITSYGSVPTIFRLFAGALVGEELFPHLRVIRLGGDRLLRSDVELFKKRFSSHCLLRNGLGAAEVLLIRQYLLDKETEVTTQVVPVGYPLEDTEVLILDEDRRPLGVDQVGEIAVKSPYMARGYWRRADLTVARFLTAPDGERIYLSGDLGRLASDGCLTRLERKDFQVKVRGRLLAPVEVETVLLDIPAITDAVVVAREDPRGERRLVAYFVAALGPTMMSRSM
jgi:amino acid adenylation domain-containing protein